MYLLLFQPVNLCEKCLGLAPALLQGTLQPLDVGSISRGGTILTQKCRHLGLCMGKRVLLPHAALKTYHSHQCHLLLSTNTASMCIMYFSMLV